MNRDKLKRIAQNALIFTAPLFVAYFTQLSMGVSFKEAIPVVALAAYGIAADFFRKYQEK